MRSLPEMVALVSTWLCMWNGTIEPGISNAVLKSAKVVYRLGSPFVLSSENTRRSLPEMVADVDTWSCKSNAVPAPILDLIVPF